MFDIAPPVMYCVFWSFTKANFVFYRKLVGTKSQVSKKTSSKMRVAPRIFSIGTWVGTRGGTRSGSRGGASGGTRVGTTACPVKFQTLRQE